VIDAEQDRRDIDRSGGYGGAWASVYDRVFEIGGTIEAEALGSLLAPGSRVVELGAGTGRVAIPLARAGHAVRAVEVSSAMAARFRANLRAEDTAVAARVEVLEADMKDHTEAPGSVAMVACVLGSIACLADPADRERTVRRAATWLVPGGHLVVETYDRTTATGSFGAHPPPVVTERSGGATLTSTYRLDPTADTWSVAHRWEDEDSDTRFDERVGFVEPAELLDWAGSAGLEPVVLFGDWFGSAYAAGRNPLYVAVLRRPA
jgi:SAM-dependent methyltransferase